MVVFIGTKEISNWIHLYAKAFEENGDTVITCAEPHPFYSDNYTHNLGNPKWLFRAIQSPRFRFLEAIRFQVAKFFKLLRKYFILLRHIDKVDLFVFVGDGFFQESTWDFQIIKRRGKKIVHVFYGGDVRDWDAFGQKYKIDVTEIEDGIISGKYFNEKVFRLRKSELYADALFSVEDQGVLALRPFYKLRIPFEVGKCRFVVKNRIIPKIVHIESRRPYKGERFIYDAIKRLKDEGLAFDFKSYKGLSHDEVYDVLEDADILVDEVMIFGPGTLGHEAIACGCALATKMQDDHFLKDLICNLDYDNIVDPLRDYILGREARVATLYKCYELLLKNASPNEVAKHIIEKLAIDKRDYSKHDYIPDFIYKEYVPPVEHSLLKSSKELTSQVVFHYANREEVRGSLIAKRLM